jgi:hypothetical protein
MFLKALNVIPVPCMYVSGIVCCVKMNVENLEQNTDIHTHIIQGGSNMTRTNCD